MHLTAADSAAVVAELRRTRRRQRVASIHWVDALYQVYITGLLSVVAVVLLSGLVGDGEVSAASVRDIEVHGPAAMGLLAAVAVLVGLRSGSRGGPLALEKPDVRHVLLSPVDRGVALRGPALRQLRFLSAVGAATGAAAGQLAARRLPGNPLAWVVCGALFGVVVVWLGFGSALVAAGVKLRTWLASLLGLGLVGWAVADLVGSVPAAPSSFVGHLALWPLSLEPADLVGAVVAGGLVYAGMRLVAGTSLEAAERRTALVGQMRFAVTLQDLRTVMVLRRQLAQEHPRARPWVRQSRRRPRFVVWHRGLRSVLRWPVSRLVRILLLAVVAGASMRGVWSGTTPLIVLAGLALWVAALDAAEPLGQEVDHPGRTDAFPIERGAVFVRHLPLTFAVSALVGTVAALVAAAPVDGAVPVGPALVAGMVGGVLAGCGAVVSVVQGAPDPVDTLSMVTPEIAGTRTVYRTAFPPALAVLGLTPLLAARAAERGASDPPPLPAAITVAVFLSVIVVLVTGWVRFRDQIKEALSVAAEQASPTRTLERQREERLAAEEREAAVLAESRRIGEEAARRQAGSAQQRAKRGKPAATPAPDGVRGGASAKPIGRARDQKPATDDDTANDATANEEPADGDVRPHEEDET